MFKYLTILFFSFSIIGCASDPRYEYPPNAFPSPMINIVRDSGGTTNTRRVPGSVMNDPYTTLGMSLLQAGEIMVRVTFNFQADKRGGDPRTSKCLLSVKSRDTVYFDDADCRMDPSGGRFVVRIWTPEFGKQSFDLYQLPGRFIGEAPPYRDAFYISTHSGFQNRNYYYLYVGKDPLPFL